MFKPKPELQDALEDLSLSQVEALQALFNHTVQLMGDEVLACSLGGDDSAEKTLISRKRSHEGAIKAERLFFKELQAIRKQADKR